MAAKVNQNTSRTQATEDYVKTIYLLQQDESPVRPARIAEARQVSSASVTNMMQKIEGLGLVHYEKHRGVTLTKSGQRMALEVLRYHRLLECYLAEELGFDWHEVHREAELLEHAISEKFAERVAAVLNYPAFDPHGQPIPTREGVVRQVETRPLTALAAGEYATVSHVTDDSDSKLLQYLARLDITPGKRVRVLEVALLDGPLTLELDEQRCLLAHNAAAAVHIA